MALTLREFTEVSGQYGFQRGRRFSEHVGGKGYQKISLFLDSQRLALNWALGGHA